jgi:uracil-DNA glycosylase
MRGHKVVVPEGEGPVVIVGDAPGRTEEQIGRAFSGFVGVKLNELFRASGIQRKDVHLTNALLCRPETPDLDGKRRFELKSYMAWLRKHNAQAKKNGGVHLENPFDCCKPRLVRELQHAERVAQELNRITGAFPNGAVVFPVGNFALSMLHETGKTFSNKALPVTKYRGSVIKLPSAFE